MFQWFPYSLQYKSEFGNREFMIWAIVSSRSCLCWLYRASLSSAAKNIINLIFGIDHLVISMCSHLLCCWKRVFTNTSAFSWQNSVSLCPASFCTPKSNLPVTPDISDFLLLHSSPLKAHHFGVSSRGSCRSSQNHSTSASLPLVVGQRLELLWYWMVCLINKQKSFCHLWDCTQVLHFRLFCWLWGLLHFF